MFVPVSLFLPVPVGQRVKDHLNIPLMVAVMLFRCMHGNMEIFNTLLLLSSTHMIPPVHLYFLIL